MALFQPVANPIPCFKGVHESIRSVMVSMKTNLHVRVDYAHRGTSVECPRVIYPRLRDLFITIRNTTIMVVFSGEKGMRI